MDDFLTLRVSNDDSCCEWKDAILPKMKEYGFISDCNPNIKVDNNICYLEFCLDYNYEISDVIQLPKKMDLFTDLDITEKDDIFIQFESEDKYCLGLNIDIDNAESYRNALLINGENIVVGIFSIIDNGSKKLLVAKHSDINFSGHHNKKYSFIIPVFKFDTAEKVFFKRDIEVDLYQTETTETHLCIDFGTSNTTAGCILDKYYVSRISDLAVSHGFLKISGSQNNNINLVSFNKLETPSSYSNLFPSVVYVKRVADHNDQNSVEFAFGYEAMALLRENLFCPKASCFMELKRWLSEIDKDEEVHDVDGNTIKIKRRDIIFKYLMHVIREAENQFKCKFKRIHMTAPVKIKNRVVELYDKILGKAGYVVERDHVIDEGVSVLYSIIQDRIDTKKYHDNKSYKVLIIDIGGGTSDLASCEYKISVDEDDITQLYLKTNYMDGDMNFGGNNFTYRIFQYMKIIFASYAKSGIKRKIDNFITQDTESIFSYIEGNDNDENKHKSTPEDRYKEIYSVLENEYNEAEKTIPTKFRDYENCTPKDYDCVKNNFYFLWQLAEQMKIKFYSETSISRCMFTDNNNKKSSDDDLHLYNLKDWNLYIKEDDKNNKDKSQHQHKFHKDNFPSIAFNTKEIDKLLRGDIYFLVRKFLNNLYEDKNDKTNLYSYGLIKLTGQSSRINIFMDSLKEFLPGKKIGRTPSKSMNAEELKLMCVKGAINYMHSLEKSVVEVTMENDTNIIPVSVFVKKNSGIEKKLIDQGTDWTQTPQRERITDGAQQINFILRYSGNNEGDQSYVFKCDKLEWKPSTIQDISNRSNNVVTQDVIDNLKEGAKYLIIYLNKQKWGFSLLPVYRDKNTVHVANEEYCSFDVDILQNCFFDGTK